MNNEILYPVGMEDDPETTVNDLRTLQAEADAAGLLLPAQYNVTLSPKAPAGGGWDDSELLLLPSVV